MKQTIIALFLVCLLSTAALGDTYFGVYGDTDGTVCSADVVVEQTLTLYVIVHLDGTIPSITAAEFCLDGLPEDTGYPVGTISYDWNTTLVISQFVDKGVALAFQTPQEGPVVLLGTIEIVAFAADYVGDYSKIYVMPTTDKGVRAVVDDLYETHTVGTSRMTLNCGDLDLCECLEDVATEPASWSSIKALY